MNERAADPRIAALARAVADEGVSLALHACEAADAVTAAHALALRLRQSHGLEVEFFVPADGDGLVARLAQIVSAVPPSALHLQGPSSAVGRVLVAADASAIPVQAEQALAALVRDCPGANTRIVLPVAGRPDPRDRRGSFGPRLVRASVDAEPEEVADGGGGPAAWTGTAEPADAPADAPDTTVAWLSGDAPLRPRWHRWRIGAAGLAVLAAAGLYVALDRRGAPLPPAAGDVIAVTPAQGSKDDAASQDGAAKDEPAQDEAEQDEAEQDEAAKDEAAASGAPDPGQGSAAVVGSRPPRTPEALPARAGDGRRAEPASEAVPSRRPDAGTVRRTRDRAYYVQHAAVATAEDARTWLAGRPALDRAGVVPIRAADGRPMMAIVTGPFPDRERARQWAEARTAPDERWIRGAPSLKAALREP